jgi:hypothetical protein
MAGEVMRDTQISSTFYPLLSMAPQDHPYKGWLKGKTDAVRGGGGSVRIHAA